MCVLELLAQHARPVPTMTIARECAIPKSSAHHLLNVMRARNFVTYYEAERAWGLGVTSFQVGSAYQRSAPLQRLGRPLMAELSLATGETSHLAVLHGADVLYVDKEQAPTMVARLVTEVGVRLPAHLTAVGRAMLAHLAEAQVYALYAHAPLVSRTDRGPQDLEELLAQLRGVRLAGIARDDGMVTPGISCAAAPVFSREGLPVAAIGVTWVTAQRDEPEIVSVTALLRRASQRLSLAMGGRAPAERLEVVA